MNEQAGAVERFWWDHPLLQPVWRARDLLAGAAWWLSGRRLVDLPCGCQDIVSRRGRVIDREHDHAWCSGEPS